MDKKVKKYIHKDIEKKWQQEWERDGLHTFKIDSRKKNYYNLVELPYPSGDLHLGHWFSFVTADTHARYKKMTGLNVFFPNGFDAFGLPAENAAIKRGINPKDWTMSNIQTMRKQFDTMGTMIDWSHQAITCLPEYYRWNQWIFLRMLEKGIAYRGKALGNWCPVDQTVLANEHVEAGKCWRCGTEVVQKEIEQWFLKITDYADQLLWNEDKTVDWPKSVREGQNNWIGKKEGINITYKIHGTSETLTVFTTRPDTNFGATFIALAPEHEVINKIINSELLIGGSTLNKIKDYVDKAKKKTEMDRKAEGREKTGVFTGLYAINPLNNYQMPIYVSDFVLAGYGTGALVGVPGHDMRDFEFAQKFKLEIIRVVVGKDKDISPITKAEQIQEEDGIMINSGFLDGMDIHKATQEIMDYIEEKGYGKRVTTYHIHDWSISRQRYWGTPIPVIHCDSCGTVPVPDDQLPVTLPDGVDFTPKGEPPLATAKDWLNVSCPKCGGAAKRDAETLDTFFDSAWYYYRYVSPDYIEGPFDQRLVGKIMPVDVYYGGAEHTLGHTLYARFFTKFFKDIGLVSFDEFAKRRVQHGVILGPDGNRMSKSKGNVVNPDDLVKDYGTDTVRTYLCFMMPYESTAPWSPEGIWGSFRFLKRVWDLQNKIATDELSITNESNNWMHKTIKKVGEDIASMKFNTAVAALMTWLNYIESRQSLSKSEYATMLLLLSPFAPHMTEELWQTLPVVKADSFSSIHLQQWPSYDEKYLVEEEASIIVQVNGKMRDNITILSADIGNQQIVEDKAKASEKTQKHLQSGEVKKVIYVPGKIINFVV
ncbi:MAG TPA: leucine--tRNA ligase [Candidatus Saccharimonadales bacterium]|nr:leucine--tRNA ligase [Candidatus Saccharimonadales bacterium]